MQRYTQAQYDDVMGGYTEETAQLILALLDYHGCDPMDVEEHKSAEEIVLNHEYIETESLGTFCREDFLERNGISEHLACYLDGKKIYSEYFGYVDDNGRQRTGDYFVLQIPSNPKTFYLFDSYR